MSRLCDFLFLTLQVYRLIENSLKSGERWRDVVPVMVFRFCFEILHVAFLKSAYCTCNDGIVV